VWLVLACTLGSPQLPAGQSNGLAPPLGVGAIAPLSGSTADHVHVVGVRRLGRASDTLLIMLQVDPGYHINANPASLEYLIPTSVAFAGVLPERVAYPAATEFKPRFADHAIEIYDGAIVIVATFPAGALDRAPGFNVTVTAQACTDEICLPPAELTAPSK